jgi:hypothetical protein
MSLTESGVTIASTSGRGQPKQRRGDQCIEQDGGSQVIPHAHCVRGHGSSLGARVKTRRATARKHHIFQAVARLTFAYMRLCRCMWRFVKP